MEKTDQVEIEAIEILVMTENLSLIKFHDNVMKTHSLTISSRKRTNSYQNLRFQFLCGDYSEIIMDQNMI